MKPIENQPIPWVMEIYKMPKKQETKPKEDAKEAGTEEAIEATMEQLEADLKAYEPPTEADEDAYDEEAEKHAHRESQSVFFTNVLHPTGFEFGATFRQGADVEDELLMLDRIALEMQNRGYLALPLRGGYTPMISQPPTQENNQKQAKPAPQKPVRPPAQPAQQPQHARPQDNVSGNRPPLANPARVVKLTNGIDGSGNVTINFWTDQATWTEFRIFHLGAERLAKMLKGAYPHEIDYDDWLNALTNLSPASQDKNKGFKLDDPGWLVWWEVSPKNPDWKDTKAVKIPSYGEPISEYLFQKSVGDPTPTPKPQQPSGPSLPI